MRVLGLGLLCCLGLAPGSFAQNAPDAFDLCAREPDSAARLSCFDRATAARHAPIAADHAVSPPSASVAGPASKPPPEAEVGLDAQQRRKLHPERAEPAKQAAAIQATVLQVTERGPRIAAFELDNGQVWQQTEAVAGLWVKPQETVSITSGALGSFWLRSADGHVARVRRVR